MSCHEHVDVTPHLLPTPAHDGGSRNKRYDCTCFIKKPLYRYDSHRDQILRSGERHQAGNTGTGMEGGGGIRPQDMEEIFQYFTTSCFSGFGDGPRVCTQGHLLQHSPKLSAHGRVWGIQNYCQCDNACLFCTKNLQYAEHVEYCSHPGGVARCTIAAY